jgi:hypothetical protein
VTSPDARDAILDAATVIGESTNNPELPTWITELLDKISDGEFAALMALATTWVAVHHELPERSTP